MRLEAASDAVKGEQLGIRAGLFNYWDQDLEVILVSNELFAAFGVGDWAKFKPESKQECIPVGCVPLAH